MNPLTTRRLGKTDVLLGQMGFGAAPLGDLFVSLSDVDADATLSEAWSAGLRYFDTSPWYGRGQSEHRVGRFLYRKPRPDVILSTKVGRILRSPTNMETFDTGFWTGGLQFEHRFDYSYDGIMRSHQDSLQRLGMNRVDMLVIHDIDRWHQGSDAMMNARLAQLATSGYRALEELKGTGQIRAIGAGLNESGFISRFVDLCDLDFVLLALHYTLGDQDALEQDIPLCLRHKIGIVVGGVFNSGLYATGPIPNSKYNYRDPSPQAIEKAAKIKAVCDRYEVPLAAAALQFPLHHPMVASVIPGAISPQQVLDNVAYFQWNIPIHLWAELKDHGLLRPDAPTP